ncbi:hypothetical protein BV898_08236 [Hypsibius exemplaris]|uniref:Otopetrin-2 n=1 Tax=Hypsibius exemplaris TaxID=2072580 RepID=A0A1W0WQY2_HYPEX|nr:hypothetical protein BV898_08236 [Hypsibius exemplaris]
MDLLRRFGSDATLSVNSLVFTPDHGHFEDNDQEVSFAPRDSGHHFRRVESGEFEQAVMSEPKIRSIKPFLNNHKRSANNSRIDLVYGIKEGPRKDNFTIAQGENEQDLTNYGLSNPKTFQMVSNLNALSNHLSSRNSEHRVHFPEDGKMHGYTQVSKRPSLDVASPLQATQSAQSIQPDALTGGLMTPRRESFEFHKEKKQHPSSPHSASHLIAEVSKHMSVLYCMLITITSASISISATLTHNMDATISRWFDSGMLAIGIAFLVFAFLYLFRKPKANPKAVKHMHIIGNHHYDHPEEHSIQDRFIENDVDSGSFYLKMGATAFAVGSMIYACLELGVFVENTSCFSGVMGLYPTLFIIYVLLQLYFIFKNSQFKITGCRALSRFGLAHLVATDICIWIRTLLDETITEVKELKQKQIIKAGGNASGPSDIAVTEEEVQSQLEKGHITDNFDGFQNHQQGYQSLCIDGVSTMHEMLETSAVFLYPCMIEYALITAGIVFIMWQSVGKSPHGHNRENQHVGSRRHPRMFSVDCSHAANGLFAGVLIIVLTLVGLIFYFLYLHTTQTGPESELMAGLCADILDVTLNSVGLLAVLYCGWQFFRKLQRIHVHNANMELDDGLLILTMIGVYAYSVLSIIGSMGGEGAMNILSVLGDILELVQSTLQTIFIFDASKRSLMYPIPERRNSDRRESDMEHRLKTLHFDKPGREMLTLLLAINFGQWAIDIMCTLRAETNTVPKEFFGTQQWAVMLHVTVPLVIFYRFHSTVCLFDIWKHSYKVHRPPRVHAKPDLPTIH